MKRFFALLVFSLIALPAHPAMVRVARVTGSRTIVLDGGATVTLRGVEVPAEEEEEAATYLRGLIGSAYVLIEHGGDVYRSPDALFVNGEMIMHAWQHAHHERFLGEVNPGPKQYAHAPTPKPAAPQRLAPPPRRSQRRAAPRGARR